MAGGLARSLWVKVGLDTKGFDTGIKKLKYQLTTIKPEFSRAQLAAAAFAVGGIAYAGKRLFDLGASVEETASKFRTVFGPETERAQGFLDEFAASAGLSNQAAQDLLATTGAIVQGMGLAGRASREYAEQVVRLAGDLSSFNNIPIEETSRAIQAAITGEREQLKRLGIVILEADVQKRALAETGKKLVKDLTQEEKAQATLALITERAGVAVGDLARTQDSAANTARRVAARLQNLKELIAQQALPIFAQLLSAVDQNSASFDAMKRFIEAVATRIREFVGGIQIMAAEVAVLAEQFKVAMAYLKFWDKEGIKEATRSLEFMRQAAEEVKLEVIATADAMAQMATGAGNISGAAGALTGGGGLDVSIGNKARAALAEHGMSVYRSAGPGNLPVTSIIAQDLQTIGSSEVQSRLQATMNHIKDGLNAAQGAAIGFADAFSMALVDSTERGKNAFTSFADHAIRELKRVFAQAAVFGFLNMLFPGSGLFAKTTLGAVLGREQALDRGGRF